MITGLHEFFSIDQDPAAFPAAAERECLILQRSDLRFQPLFAPCHMAQLGERIQPYAVNGALHHVVRHRGQEFHNTRGAEQAHLNQESRDGALEIREHAAIGEVAGLKRAADETVIEQLAQVLHSLLHILETNGGKGSVNDAVSGVILLAALAVGDDNGLCQLRFSFRRDCTSGPHIVMMGDMTVIVVFLNGRPGPFLQAAVGIQKIGGQGSQLLFPVGNILFLNPQCFAALNQVRQDFAADGVGARRSAQKSQIV